jgi:diacylglycerol kinase family enzyme
MTSPSAPPIRLPPHLSPDRDVHVVLSIFSGKHEAQPYYDNTLKPLLTQHDIHHQVHTTTSITSIINLTKSRFINSATKGVKQTILLLSGDGGIIDIVNTISTLLMRDTYDSRVGTIFVRPVVCLFPLGTANALAWSSGIAADPISTMLHGRPRPLPMFEAKFSPASKLVTDEGRAREALSDDSDDEPVIYGAVVFSWGLHASLVATSDTAEYRKHGLDRFKMAAQELLKEPHLYKGTVRFRRERHGEWEDLTYPNPASTSTVDSSQSPPSKQHIYILAPLVSRLEQSFVISPSTQPLSSQLRLLAVEPPPTDQPSELSAQLSKILTLAYQSGAHTSHPSVVYEEIDALKIHFEEDDDERWRMVCVDGKIVSVGKDEGKGGGGWVEVQMLPAMGMDGRRVVELVVPR